MLGNNKTIDYKEIEKALLIEHNKLRSNPKSYIPILENTLQYYRKLNILHFIGEIPFKTHEGKTLINSSIKFLQSQPPLPELIYSPELSKACYSHLKDIGKNGLISHEGSNGSTISERVDNCCQWDIAIAENLDFGTKKAENIIIKFILCDGDSHRYQRTNLFNKEMKYIGISVGEHSLYGICAVVLYAINVRNLMDEMNEKMFYQDYLHCSLDTYKDIDQSKEPKITKVFRKCNGVIEEATKTSFTLTNGTEYVEESN